MHAGWITGDQFIGWLLQTGVGWKREYDTADLQQKSLEYEATNLST